MEAAGGEDPRTAVVLDLRARELKRAPPGLAVAKRCRSLDVSCNALEYIDGLGSLHELRELKLYGNRLALIEGLQRLANLQVLLLNGNCIKTVEGISHLRQLKTLRLDGNEIERVGKADLGRLSALTALDLSANRIESLAGALDGLPALEELNVSDNKLATLEGVSRCTKLSELDASRNAIGSLKGLATLTRLDVLRLSSNQITSVKALVLPARVEKDRGEEAGGAPASRGLSRAGTGTARRAGTARSAAAPPSTAGSAGSEGTSNAARQPRPRVLTELYLADNRIADLTPLGAACPQLEVLDVSRNALEDLAHIADALSQLEPLTELQVAGNPATEGEAAAVRRRLVRATPNLDQLDGTEVGQADRASEGLEEQTYADGATMRRDQHAEVLTLQADEGAGAGSSDGGDGGGVKEFMARANITSVPAEVLTQMASSAGVSYNAAVAARPGTPAMGGAGPSRGGTAGRRPATPLEHLGARPFTPLNGKAPNPMMHARPPSARTGHGRRLPTAAEYSADANKFVNEFESYSQQMRGMLDSIRAGLKGDVKSAIEHSAKSHPAGGGHAQRAIPKMPLMPQLKDKAQVEKEAQERLRQKEKVERAKRPSPPKVPPLGAVGGAEGKGQPAVGEGQGQGQGQGARPKTPADGGLTARLRERYGAANRSEVHNALAMFERMYGASTSQLAAEEPGAVAANGEMPTAAPAAEAQLAERAAVGAAVAAASSAPAAAALQPLDPDDDENDWDAWPDDPDDPSAAAEHAGAGSGQAAEQGVYDTPQPPMIPRGMSPAVPAPGRAASPAPSTVLSEASAVLGGGVRVGMSTGGGGGLALTKSQLTGRSAERRHMGGAAAAAQQGYQRFRPPSARRKDRGEVAASPAPLLRPPSPAVSLTTL